MKKLAVIAALLTASTAHASIYDTPAKTNAWYYQVDLGYSDLDFKYQNLKRSEDGVGVKVAIGKDKGNYRYAFDYSYYGDVKTRRTFDRNFNQATNSPFAPTRFTQTIDDEYTITAHSLGATAYYDFKNSTPITPYVGVRAGVNFVNDELYRCIYTAGIRTICGYDRDDDAKVRLGAGAIIGAAYQIKPNVAATISGEYNYLGKIDDVKISQAGGHLGMRVQF
ncbi:opacity family porin [Moraxella marmotae]|uniref:opacity family porin n=1 Tax=Moraxella marmotae TaxID=3344520 RepID=UPI0035F3F7E6